jgi:hypothetical protein
MRRIIFILTFLCVTVCANAQVVPLTPLFLKDGWSTGYYYDKSGKKVDGILKDYIPMAGLFKEHYDYFYFKATDTSRKTKIQARDINSFVVGVDTFTISHADQLIGKPFLQVMMNESVKLYASDIRHTMPVANGMAYVRYVDTAYYYGSDPDNITLIRNRNLKAAMKILLSNYPELLKKIQNGEFGFDDIESIVNYYNGMKFEASRKKRLGSNNQ